MSRVIEDLISEEDFEKNRVHFEALENVNIDDKFRYALCLIKCKEKKRVENAIEIFQDIFDKTDDNVVKRDSLYYMAVGEAKLYNYEKSLDYLKEIIKIKQNNPQVYELYEEVSRRYRKDALIGLGVTAGATSALVFGVGFYGFIKVAGALIKTIR
jgi:tetratricopeptide (TPR) repeat protein